MFYFQPPYPHWQRVLNLRVFYRQKWVPTILFLQGPDVVYLKYSKCIEYWTSLFQTCGHVEHSDSVGMKETSLVDIPFSDWFVYSNCLNTTLFSLAYLNKIYVLSKITNEGNYLVMLNIFFMFVATDIQVLMHFLVYFNPFMPTGAFNICCPRDCVSRHNGGTQRR